jgi:hypothetical protein
VNAFATCSPITPSSSLTGSLGGANATSTVALTVDGASTPIRTVSASTGNWTMPLSGISNGNHDYSISGVNSVSGAASAAVTGSFTITDTSGSGVQDASQIPVYRFNSSPYNDHYYTMDRSECQYILATWPTTWSYEGVAFNAFSTQVTGTVPLYRYWSPVYQGHFFTADANESAYVQATWPSIWDYEGVDFYVYPEDLSAFSSPPPTLQVARFWSAVYGQHFYTVDPVEAAHIEATYPSNIWAFENYNFRVPAN